MVETGDFDGEVIVREEYSEEKAKRRMVRTSRLERGRYE